MLGAWLFPSIEHTLSAKEATTRDEIKAAVKSTCHLEEGGHGRVTMRLARRHRRPTPLHSASRLVLR